MKGIRRVILPVIFVLFSAAINATAQSNFSADFLDFWTRVKENYAYFDKKHTDWDKVKALYLPRTERAKSKQELITIFEQALEELYDNHFSLNTNLRSSTRLVPTGLDVWAEWVGNRVIVTEVRKGFSAEQAGMKSGMEIVSINGITVESAVLERVGKCIAPGDLEAKNYALRQLLAGTYLTKRVIGVRHDRKGFSLNLDDRSGNLTDNHRYDSLLESKIVDANIGYIRFNNSLGQTDVIQLFDAALDRLKDTRALIIDLRETPSGGNSVVARGILSRFITKEMPYQKHVLPNEEKEFKIKRSWLEIVSPRGPFSYSKPVVVLVNHWTGSMGEGIAIGFDGLGRAKIVGTKMAALNGAIEGFETANSKIPYGFPTEQLYHINGTAREFFKPSNLIDLTERRFRDIDDPILREGIQLVKGK